MRIACRCVCRTRKMIACRCVCRTLSLPKEDFGRIDNRRNPDFRSKFSRAWVLDWGYEPLKNASKICISSIVNPSKIFVLGSINLQDDASMSMCLSNSQDDDVSVEITRCWYHVDVSVQLTRWWCVCRNHKMLIACRCVCPTHQMMMCLSNSQDDDSMSVSVELTKWW